MAIASTGEIGPARWRRPTRWSAVVFTAKVRVLRVRRALVDRLGGAPVRHVSSPLALPVELFESRTALFGDMRPQERGYQEGKVANLRRAAAALDGVLIPAGQVLSFWRQVGRPARDRGFVVGRMLQQGCLVPSVGGGLCQLSNALYQVARQSGCDIVERHAHSRLVAGSDAVAGADATVAWNYVDLRIRPTQDVRLEVTVDDEALIVRFTGAEPASAVDAAPADPVTPAARSCATCDETACFRHEGAIKA
jgi:vancomycin resistance protein YoaR